LPTPATGDENAIAQRRTALAEIRGASASKAAKVVTRTSATRYSAVRTAVKAAGRVRSVASDVYHQLLSRGDRNNDMHTPAIGFGRTPTVSAARNDRDMRHARWHREILRCARVVKRFMVRKLVRGTACRHHAVTSAGTAASRKHGNDHANT
jgi:hypothetical protein